jgi:hypothetical protein
MKTIATYKDRFDLELKDLQVQLVDHAIEKNKLLEKDAEVNLFQ